MSKIRAVPEGYHTLTPAIICKNAARAIDFYKEVFGAKEISRMKGPGDTIGHAEIQIGDSRLMLGDEFPGVAQAPGPAPNTSNSLIVYTDNVDAVFERAVKAGCKVEMALQNQFWGDRYGKVRDPFGHQWGLAQHVEDVSQEEMEKRATAWMAGVTKAAGQS